MAITEKNLLDAGFTPKEILTMKRAIKTSYLVGGVSASYESTLLELRRRWGGIFIVIGISLLNFFLSFIQHKFKETFFLNLCITLFSFAVCYYVIPLKIATKARSYIKRGSPPL